MTTATAFDPMSEDYQQNPFGYYRAMRHEAPAYFIESMGVWALFRYEDVVTTLRRPELYSSRDWINNALGEFDPVPQVPSIISSDPPDHARLRRLASKAFVPGLIKKMEPGIRGLISELLDEVQDRSEFDYVSDFAANVPVNVTAQILGADKTIARNEFKRWTADLIRSGARSVLPQEELDRIHRSVNELRGYFTELIAYRRIHPGDDLVSALVQAEEDQQVLSADEVLSLTFIIQFGGAETPSHLISSALWECFGDPALLDAVKTDPDVLPLVIDETFRHVSPVRFLGRTTTQDIELHGKVIPADSVLLSYIASACRDETVFAEPDTFDINRPGLSRHLALGMGPHYCIGAVLGKMMCGLALGMTLQRMPNLRPVADDVTWLPSPWVRGLASYLVAP
ncbi:cytochrome P450 [Pseudonocardia endophytica]|uniref:Cytochrome P450 n=1 Tax=Pseudonocardia endophytica TaxID=401976 RepID=A0A4R1HU48_PSEEN|nr:cytochrome P450 [Pseudonocardia endophytica]TCK25778.1 cytochrome P450 [Pseudonocardia endophytica]